MSDIAQEADRIVIDGVSTGWALPKIGPLPLPVFLAASLVTGLAIHTGKLPNDVIGGLSVMMLAGFL